MVGPGPLSTEPGMHPLLAICQRVLEHYVNTSDSAGHDLGRPFLTESEERGSLVLEVIF